MEGVVSLWNNPNLKTDCLNFLVENDDGIFKIDIVDESKKNIFFTLFFFNNALVVDTSNWMGFVRKADTFDEQNLVITQENGALYFTSTTDILPKQELKVVFHIIEFY